MLATASTHRFTIPRLAIRSPWDGDAPQRRVNLNAQRALGRILDKRAWWTKTLASPGLGDGDDELVTFFVRMNVEQALAVWKDGQTVDFTYLSQRALDAVALPFGDGRCVAVNAVFAEMVSLVQSSWYFYVGVEDPDDPNGEWDRQWDGENASASSEEDFMEEDEGEDDSGDEFALDDAGNVVPFGVAMNEAKQWLRQEWGYESDNDESKGEEDNGDNDKNKGMRRDGNRIDDPRHEEENPFGHIAWFVCLLLTRERLLELTPESATLATVRQILRRGPTRSNTAVITRTLSFIHAWLHADSPDSPTTIDAMVPSCLAKFSRELLQLHLTAIRNLMEETKQDVSTTLHVIVEHLGLKSESAVAVPGSVALSWMKDASLSEDQLVKLQSQLAGLRSSVADKTGQTALLVDPELFCAVVGQTLHRPSFPTSEDTYVTPSIQMRSIMSTPSDQLIPVVGSSAVGADRVRWLPTEVQFDSSTGKASIRSYINNLHPAQFPGLYTSIERILTQLIPLFENVLSSLDQGADFRSLKGLYDHCQYSLPRAPRLVPRGLFDVGNAQFPLTGTQCQVVIRVSEIQLTPEQPKFFGDVWCSEGNDADQIIATGVFFYSVENVTAPQLAFRSFVQYPDHKPDDDVTLGLEYGLQSQEVLAQELGYVTALEGRSVVFPNLYQYKVNPFHLVDRLRPGTLGMVTVMLVAPMASSRVISTAVVPPQQSDWIQREREPILRQLNLPEVVETLVRDFSRDGLTLEETTQLRDKRLAQARTWQTDESHYLWYHRSDRGGF